MLKWSDTYATGEKTIDEQHKKLFQYVNDIESSIQEKDISHAVILRVLDFFEDYAKFHFGNEEACMYRHKCPIAQANQDAHRRFIESYENFKVLLRKEGASYQLFTTLLAWAQDWLLNHICKIDSQLRPYVNTDAQAKET